MPIWINIVTTPKIVGEEVTKHFDEFIDHDDIPAEYNAVENFVVVRLRQGQWILDLLYGHRSDQEIVNNNVDDLANALMNGFGDRWNSILVEEENLEVVEQALACFKYEAESYHHHHKPISIGRSMKILILTTPKLIITKTRESVLSRCSDIPEEYLRCRTQGYLILAPDDGKPIRRARSHDPNMKYRWILELRSEAMRDGCASDIVTPDNKGEEMLRLLGEALSMSDTYLILMEREYYDEYESLFKELAVATDVHHHEHELMMLE